MSATPAFATAFKPKFKSRRPQQWSKIKLLEDVSPWVPNCVNRISGFSQLPQNWDSYGSDPVSKDALRMALLFLSEGPLELIPEPTVSPVAGGGLGFHWRVDRRDLEFEFLPDGTVEYLKSFRPEQGETAPEEGKIEQFGDPKLWYWLAGEQA
jgi:hypothetical protein